MTLRTHRRTSTPSEVSSLACYDIVGRYMIHRGELAQNRDLLARQVLASERKKMAMPKASMAKMGICSMLRSVVDEHRLLRPTGLTGERSSWGSGHDGT